METTSSAIASACLIERRKDGSIAFSICGDLQFDSRDERLYHENLVLPALCLARSAGSPLRVLICGGGDGLALRECLRFPDVVSVDLVDLSAEVIELGRTEFAELNDHAFSDPRVTVSVQDAWAFLESAGAYDVIIADFSVPRASVESHVFTQEFYAHLKAHLTPSGVIAANAVSPQTSALAFWSQVRSVRAAGLSSLPFRSCIPSFRDRGYGAWGVILASRRRLTSRLLRGLACPVTTQQADLTRLARAARFQRLERLLVHIAPTHTLACPCLVQLLLNPGGDPVEHQRLDGAHANSGSIEGVEGLANAIQVSHPYHTRVMVATIVEQIAGDLSRIHLGQLVEELLKRAKRLPAAVMQELRVLQAAVSDGVDWQGWSAKLLAALVIVLTVANTLAPDHAFAKGSFGHASVSRGGGFGSESSFGGSGPVRSISVSQPGFRSSGFGGRTSGPVDMSGHVYPARIYYSPSYYDGYSGGYSSGYGGSYGSGAGANQSGSNSSQSPAGHAAVFVADDDLLVLDNGDLVVTLSPAAYLSVSQGRVALMGKDRAGLMPFAYEPSLHTAITNELLGRLQNAEAEIKLRRDWLSWVNWTAALIPQTRADQQEVKNLNALEATLSLARQRLGKPLENGYAKPVGATELFVGAYLYDDRFEFLKPDGTIAQWAGAELRDSEGRPTKVTPPPAFTQAMISVLKKLQDETVADQRASAADLYAINRNEASLRSDLAQYQQIYYQMGYGSYSVDYGTDEIPVTDAIQRTQADLNQSALDRQLNAKEANQQVLDAERIKRALRWLGA